MQLTDIEAYIRSRVAESEETDTFRTPLVAVSSASDRWYGQLSDIIGPHFSPPEVHMPGARTVISFFIPFTARVVAANRREIAVSEVWAHTYVVCNRLINSISQGLVQLLEQNGHRAATVAATHTYDPANFQTSWSHKSAACIAGLGQFGRHQLLITEKGCAGRFGTVFTDLDLFGQSSRPLGTVSTDPALPAAGQSPQHCLYHLGKGCDYCVQACPAGALDSGKLDKHACHAQLLATNDRFSNLDKCDSCGKCAMGPCAYFE